MRAGYIGPDEQIKSSRLQRQIVVAFVKCTLYKDNLAYRQSTYVRQSNIDITL